MRHAALKRAVRASVFAAAVTMLPPMVRPTIPPGVVPGERQITYQSLLGKPSPGANPIALSDIPGQTTTTKKFLRSTGTGSVAGTPTWDTLVAADVTGDVAATRKFLRSLGSGASPGTTVWDTLTAADIGAGSFPSGSFTFPGAVTITGTSTLGNVTASVAIRATNPSDVSVPNATPTTIFSAPSFFAVTNSIGDAGCFAFESIDGASIGGLGVLKRCVGISVVALLASNGSGVALSMSGTDVQLTHTSGATRTFRVRLAPAITAFV
ncbi:MAG: hypothetical protein JWM41_2907 [Gemmatimonadetes bacterium]|nr:hypothetical protein [Gemmatimonadota bacterium]